MNVRGLLHGTHGKCWAAIPPTSDRFRQASTALELEPLIGEIYHFDHHITVRGLQPHFEGVTADSPAVRGYVEALAEAVKNLERPIEVHFRGVALTPSGVMVCGYPVNDAAEEFRSLLAESLALRNLDSYERHMARDIWHATLAGFAGKLCDPNALIDWVAARRTMDLGITTCVRAEVTRWTARDHRQIGIPLSSAGIPN